MIYWIQDKRVEGECAINECTCSRCLRFWDFKSKSNCIPDNSAPSIVWRFYSKVGGGWAVMDGRGWKVTKSLETRSLRTLEASAMKTSICWHDSNNQRHHSCTPPFHRSIFIRHSDKCFISRRCGLKCFVVDAKCNTFSRHRVAKFSLLCWQSWHFLSSRRLFYIAIFALN